MTKLYNERDVKTYAKQLLLDTDYAMTVDVSAKIDNASEFEAFRDEVRKIYFNPTFPCSFPYVPEPIWSTPTE